MFYLDRLLNVFNSHLKRNWYWHYDADVKVNAMLHTESRKVDSRSHIGKIPVTYSKNYNTVKSIILPDENDDQENHSTEG